MPVFNRKALKEGFAIIIDDGIKYSYLSGPDGNLILLPTPMALVNLFESLGYRFIRAEQRPTKSTALLTGDFGKILGSKIIGLDLDDYEKNSIVYIFKKN